MDQMRLVSYGLVTDETGESIHAEFRSKGW
jgi:hypothetical protein